MTNGSAPATRTFAELGVSAPVVKALAERDVERAFPIQEAVIEAALAGSDICGKAPTGSGKTLAFGIPAVELAAVGQPWTPTALILSPTRELASQIKEELAPLARARSRRIETVFGGTNIERDIKRLEQGVDILVACPGRLEDLISRRCVELRDATIVVVDEADRMADMGFLPSVKRILDQTPDNRHTMLFSATLDGDVDTLISRYQHDPRTFEVDDGVEEPGDVTHSWHLVEAQNRIDIAADILRRHWSSIVFCRTRRGCDRVAKLLAKRDLAAVAIHGDRSQAQRERALESFTTGKAQVLVATDVAARGIHVDDVELVLHYDPANSDKDYVHRSGRTGRAGRNGRVISLVVSDKEKAARQLQRDLGESPGFTPLDLASLPDPAIASQAAEKAREVAATSATQNRRGTQKRSGGRNDRDSRDRGHNDRSRKKRGHNDRSRKNRGHNDRDRENRGHNDRDREDRDDGRPSQKKRGSTNKGARHGRRGPDDSRRGERTSREGRDRRSANKSSTKGDRRPSRDAAAKRRRNSNDWYPPGWSEDRDEQRSEAGGSNTAKRKSRAAKGRHADRDNQRNRGQRRGRRQG